MGGNKIETTKRIYKYNSRKIYFEKKKETQ